VNITRSTDAEAVIIAVTPDFGTDGEDARRESMICASEWKVPKQRFDIDDVQCHESFTLPIPTELRRRPAKLGV